jgi:sugar O-acyltransferase (sialic acid O-acetyltransferase NeuD family)
MLMRESRNIRGIITRDAKLVGTSMLGVPVLGLEEEVRFAASEVTLVNGVGNIASHRGSGLDVRASIYQNYHAQGFAFLPLLSEHALIQPEVTMGDGVQVMPGTVIQPGAMIGENVIVNTGASIDHDVVIYPHAHIAPGAVLCGHVVIGEETHVGAGAVIIQGVRVGSNAVIGAGTVVTRNVPDNAVIRPGAMEQVKTDS